MIERKRSAIGHRTVGERFERLLGCALVECRILHTQIDIDMLIDIGQRIIIRRTHEGEVKEIRMRILLVDEALILNFKA